VSAVLDFGTDPARTIRKKFAEWQEDAARRAREHGLRTAYNERHGASSPHLNGGPSALSVDTSVAQPTDDGPKRA
jgi:hypothetical protein